MPQISVSHRDLDRLISTVDLRIGQLRSIHASTNDHWHTPDEWKEITQLIRLSDDLIWQRQQINNRKGE